MLVKLVRQDSEVERIPCSGLLAGTQRRESMLHLPLKPSDTVPDQPTAVPADQPMTVPADQAALPEPVQPAAIVVPDPQASPAVTVEPTGPDEVILAPEPTEPVPTAPIPPPAPACPRKQRISDDTLAEWQATLARQAAQRRREIAAIAARKTRAETFRQLRQALKQLDQPAVDPAMQGLAEDELAVQVHEAPEHIREVLAALLASLSARRSRRQGR